MTYAPLFFFVEQEWRILRCNAFLLNNLNGLLLLKVLLQIRKGAGNDNG